MKYPSYSVAIRTLGTSGDKFVKELKSIYRQTIAPEKVVVYIADGYPLPDYRIGSEQYVVVKKGMVAQRALKYDEIDSEYILLLDDDVELSDNSVELLFKAIIGNNADCVTADVFHNHKMSKLRRVYNICANLVFPFRSNKWSRIILSNGSIAYNGNPSKHFYSAQSGEGPASLWKKSAFCSIKYSDECWLDNLPFAYSEDQLMFYKLHVNGGNLGTIYRSGITHLDGKSASSAYQSNPQKFITRSQASLIIWHRTLFQANNIPPQKKIYNLFSFILKSLWLLPVHIIASISLKDIRIPFFYIKGLYLGIKFINSSGYKSIPNYVINSI